MIKLSGTWIEFNQNNNKMTSGIIIHISVGDEKRTEFFTEDVIRIGSDTQSELQIRTAKVQEEGVWFEMALKNGVYRIKTYSENVDLNLNGKPIQKFAGIKDGDIISIDGVDISFSFFSLKSESSLIVTNRDPHVAQFIEEAALEASITEKRDDAKAFLREFSRELLREISIRTKFIALALIISVLGGVFYLGYGFYKESQLNRQRVEEQNRVIGDIKKEIVATNDQIKGLDKSNKDIIKNISLAPNLRVDYGNGICLIVGVYDLVDRTNGKKLRYPDPDALKNDRYEPAPMEEGMYEMPDQQGLTTAGNGSPVEYDFIGTGFHVGNGYIVTNRHVLQPWSEDDLVKQLMRESKGRARIKRLVIYFPGFPNPFPLSVKKVSAREDVAVASIDPNSVSPDIPVLPLSANSESVAIGKTVVTMGYPNGPDRLLAMVDDREAKTINQKYGNSRQALINFLAQSRKIVPLTTQGAITDLDSRRIVHDAKTAEGGSGAPLFGQSGKVIGVNFGVFTENNASNMAVPISFAIALLERVGWKPPVNKTTDVSPNPQTAKIAPETAAKVMSP